MTDIEEEKSNANKAFDYLVSKGVKKHIAAGLVGNLMQESYELENTWAGGELDRKGSKGIMQWHGNRLNNLYKYMKDKDPNYTNGAPISMYDQLDFILYEAETGAGDPWMKEQYDKAFAASNSQEAALAFSNNVIRPNRKHAENEKRMAYAESLNSDDDSGDISRISNPETYREVSTVEIDNTDVSQNYSQPKSMFGDIFETQPSEPQQDQSSILPDLSIEQEEPISRKIETPAVQPMAKKESYADLISKYIQENSGKFAMGGQFNSFENGGTHEQNPHGGIPMGVNLKGIMNTVEEGETSFDFEDGKYIFSNRIKL